MFIGDVGTADSPLLVNENKASSINQNEIYEKTNSFKGDLMESKKYNQTNG